MICVHFEPEMGLIFYYELYFAENNFLLKLDSIKNEAFVIEF